MTERPRIPPPNYTQFPNVVLDNMHALSLAEIKVISVVCRQTFGFHRNAAKLSVSLIQKLSGLSEGSVRTGIQELLKRNWICRDPSGDSFTYMVNLETIGELGLNFEGAQNLGGSKSEPQEGQNLEGEGGQNLDPYKEKAKRKKETLLAQEGKGKKKSKGESEPNPQHQPFIDQWCELYKHQFGRPYQFNRGHDAKAVKQLLTNRSIDEILDAATKAWARPSGFNCKYAATIAGLNSKWNEILLELDTPPKVGQRKEPAKPDYSKGVW